MCRGFESLLRYHFIPLFINYLRVAHVSICDADSDTQSWHTFEWPLPIAPSSQIGHRAGTPIPSLNRSTSSLYALKLVAARFVAEVSLMTVSAAATKPVDEWLLTTA